MHQRNRIEIEVDHRFRAVATCTACGAMLAQGPEADRGFLAAYALGIAMGVGVVTAEQLFRVFHRGPACPGGSMRITIEQLTPARPAGGRS